MPTAYLPIIGRLGNILFQVAHGLAWCEQNGYTLAMHPWVGDRIFTLPQIADARAIKPDLVWGERLLQEQEDIIYTRKQVREWFTFKPQVLQRLSAIRPVDLLFDVRHGQDILDAGLVHLSIESYARAAHDRGYPVNEAYWEIYPDNPTRLPSFDGDDTSCGLGVSEVSIPAFYRLMTAKVHFRAPSTFSWWAATLGNATVYSPVIRNICGGVTNQHCGEWVHGNWPAAAASHSDWHIKE